MSQVSDRLSMIDLFAGCGGMTVGFHNEGFRPILSVEWDRAAASTYAANFGKEHTRWEDIEKIEDDEIPDADVIIGGPPCQGFSNLGTKSVEDPRNKLWKQYLRFVVKANPQVFVIENVERFSRTNEFQLLMEEADHGILKGYKLTPGVLLAADYGVSQRRPRTIVIGSRIGKIPLPEQTHAKVPTGELKPWRTVRDAIGWVDEHPTTTELPPKETVFFEQSIRGDFSGYDIHFGRQPTPMSLERYDHIPPGGGRFNLPDHLLSRCWREKKTGTTDVMGRMRWDAPSLTIRTEFFKPEKGQYLHPQWEPERPERRVNRVITHYEASLLQDFPKDYKWCGSKTEIAKQIGNAVPSGLAAAIAKHLKKYLN
ncbi:DNA cytosine methyltransferase [Micromonospora sp. WP24]|uniref:DNA cytosine methyltransferase n=1 Tax=Micromonospora sp. WP24 TaxID=2604469 RepID=UPI0011DABC54|nr:DNA cytosine methyltransferase [Micromonospora sp. WP24]TYB96324.1 DNA cytosine methyltransferase [Micromonospora sp. WP24]